MSACRWCDLGCVWEHWMFVPFSRGSAWSSTSCELRYLELPWDFLVFFLSDRFANGSMRSTNVPDILSAGGYWLSRGCSVHPLGSSTSTLASALPASHNTHQVIDVTRPPYPLLATTAELRYALASPGHPHVTRSTAPVHVPGAIHHRSPRTQTNTHTHTRTLDVWSV